MYVKEFRSQVMEGGLKLENAIHKKALSQIIWNSHGAISLSRSIIEIVFDFFPEFRKNETFYLFLPIMLFLFIFEKNIQFHFRKIIYSPL